MIRTGTVNALSRAALLIAATILMSPVSASAATCVGSCGVSGANGDVTAPPGGGTYTWISTAGGVTGAGQLPSVGGTDGSLLTSDIFSASAGQNLGYNFNFVTSDGQAGRGAFIYEDYAWVKLVNATTGQDVATLFTARTEPSGSITPGTNLPAISSGVTLNPASVPISTGTGSAGGPLWSPLGSYSGQCWGAGCGLTGWVQSNFTITQSGNYKVEFGVSNWGDTIYDTCLAVSGLNIAGTQIGEDPTAAVPELGTWNMMLAGFGMVGMMLRRRSPALV